MCVLRKRKVFFFTSKVLRGCVPCYLYIQLPVYSYREALSPHLLILSLLCWRGNLKSGDLHNYRAPHHGLLLIKQLPNWLNVSANTSFFSSYFLATRNSLASSSNSILSFEKKRKKFFFQVERVNAWSDAKRGFSETSCLTSPP